MKGQRQQTKAASKVRLSEARKLAKACGVSVYGWNGTPGREFISVGGDGEKLQIFRAALERDGWHAWPQSAEEDGSTMDLSLYPPPEQPAPTETETAADQTPLELPNVLGTYTYRGPGGLFLNWCFVLAFIFGSIPWINKYLEVLSFSTKAGLSAGVVAMGALLGLPVLWIEISGDADKLTIRRHFFGARRYIYFRELKRAAIITDKSKRRGTFRFLSLTCTSGKSLELYLPTKKQRELLAFINFIKSRHAPSP